MYTTHGMIGDRFTVNRTIQPYFKVEARKYRFRVLNGGPSRLYELFLQKEGGSDKSEEFFVISTDGNLLPQPIETDEMRLGVAERHDIIVDFSKYKPGDFIYPVNRMEIREKTVQDGLEEIVGFKAIKSCVLTLLQLPVLTPAAYLNICVPFLPSTWVKSE